MEKKILLIALSITILAAIFMASLSATRDTTNSSYNGTCMKNAISKREAVIYSAFQNYTGNLLTSLQNRSSSLINDYSINDSKQRNKAVKETWKTYRSSIKQYKKELNSERKDAWKTFRSEKKDCKAIDNDENEADDVDA